ncbi:ferritin-like domain-containing protein [Nocardioidaceae bacterium]|nr:ferritin-like domain-containing protein [Nocardioidaceae bacterium]
MRPLEALQAALRSEHAAVYVYGVLGARADASDDAGLAEQVRAAYDLHVQRRGELEQRVRRAGGTPAVAAVGYVTPQGLARVGGIRSAALEVEERAAAVYAELAGSTTGGNRAWAVDALTDAAVRRVVLGAGPEDYPGLPGMPR